MGGGRAENRERGGWVVGRVNPAVWYRGLDGVPEFFVPGRLRRVRGWCESGIGRYEPGRQGRRDRVTHILLFIPFNNTSVSTTIQFKIISKNPPPHMVSF